MTRTETTLAIAKLIIQIEQDRCMGIHPYRAALDYGKRSDEEQKRLFDLHLSKCDGVNKISGHQTGRAFDILLFEEGVFVDEWPKELIARYHDVFWEGIGGKNDISWDAGHFEG